MKKFVLYCKSYRNDVLRVKRLAESIEKFNPEEIPFYVSAPLSDMPLFQEVLSGKSLVLIGDEEIIRANPALIQAQIDALPGGKSQQIVKSEFWRLGLSESYLCIDSDCVFIRPISESDFITPDGCPYTVIHEAKELLQFAINHGMEKVVDDFHRERRQLMAIFGRTGHVYDFGPTPLLWSRQVWEALDEEFLKPNNMNFYDAIMQFPGEIQWYGEAMLKFRPFPLMPAEPFFKVHHYERQFTVGKQQGETTVRLAQDYLGVCYQSSWDRQSDFVPKPLLSRMARWMRRKIFRRYR
ncbi:MAG: DUF6492 family protein [Methylophilaceae bacterium]